MNRDPNATRRRERLCGSTGTRPSSREESTEIAGGRVVTPEGVHDGGSVVVRGSEIHRVTPSHDRTEAGTTIDATGTVVLPGLIDLHGDDIEQHLFPRPEARIETPTAVINADRANVVNGITTKLHAIAFENDPDGTRTVSLAEELVAELDDPPALLGDNRVHARCELTESVGEVRELIEGNVDIELVSLMNHVPGEGQFADREAFEHRYVEGRDLTTEAAKQLIEHRTDSDGTTVRERASKISSHADNAEIPVASHDDSRVEHVERMAETGVSISEFPVTLAAAERACELGLDTVMGAPNLVRGGSLWDNVAVEDAIAADAVDVLCSDYHPPSLLAAPFVSTGEPLHVRVARVTSNPADAIGLDDRGRLQEGLRADVLVVDPDPVPTVERAFVNGDEILQAGGPNGRSARLDHDPMS